MATRTRTCRPTADVAINTAPHVASTETSYWRTRPEMSLMPASNDLPPMGTWTTYYIRPGMATQVRETIAKLNGALKKTNWPLAGIWYELANGGEPAFAVFTPRKGMADMQPPEPSMQARAARQPGEAEARAAWKALFDAVSRSIVPRGPETFLICEVPDSTGWRVRGRGGAAEVLGMKPTTLESRMAKLGMKRPQR